MSCILLLASLAWSQTGPGPTPLSTTQLILPVFQTNIAPATQANAARVGNPGPQTIYYWMVTNFTLGSSSPVGPFSVINAPNTLSSGNYVAFTPSYPAGIASIDLLKTSSPTPPSGACNCAVATGVTSGTINDQSNSTSSYTVNPLDVSDYTMTLDNEVQGAGSSHLILRQDGVFVADLSVGGGGATIGGDLAANSSVSQEVIGILNHALPGLATGYLNWTGAAWAFSAGAAGTVTGSGTANKIPRWTSGTALGNSAITDNGSNLVTVNNEQFQVNGPVMGVGPGTPALNIGQSAGNTSSACSNYNTDLTHPFPLQCISSEFTFTPDSSSTITSSWGAWFASASNAKSVSNVMASLAATNLAQGTVNESRAIHAASVNIGTTSISTGVFAETLNSSSNSQITTARALYAVNAYLNNGGTPSGATNSYGLYVDSPNISGSTSTISHQYGIYVADQTVAGTGVNSDPWGIYEAGTAPNRFGGSLTLAGLATGCLTNISGLISSTGSTCGGGGGSLPSGAHGNELANNNGTTGYAAIANTVHSASFTLPSLSTLTGGCGASPAPCVITADPNTTSAIPVATTTAIGSFTQPVTFLGGGTPLQVTATSGDGIDIYQWGALNCLGNKGPGSGTVSGCRITQGSTSTVTSIVSNGVQDGTQSDFLMRGWDIKSNPAATASVGCGVLCLVAVEGKLHVEDSSVGAYAGQIAINLQDSASNAGTNNALVFTNVFAYCNHYLNCLPLNIWGATGTGTGSGANYLFDGGAFVDSGNANPNSLTTVPLCRDGNPCLANIDGQSGGSVAQYISGVTLNTNYFETGIAMNSAGSYIEANNIRGLNVNNAVFSGGPALQNCVKISHSASGLFGYAFITGRVLANRCVDTINNSITNTVLTSASGQDIAYLYPGDNPTGGGFVVDGAQIIEGNLSLPSLTQYGIVYPSTSAGLLSTVTPPTANGNYQLVENVTGGVAVAPQFALPGIPVNPQTGTTYTYLYSDRGSRVTFSNASAIAATLPQAGSTGFTSNWTNLSCNTGAGTATITPTTSTISWTNGAAFNSAQASMPLSTGACAYLYSDNTNYSAVLLNGAINSCSKVVNGFSYAACYPQATIATKVNQCIIDAETLANGNTTGVCDARGVSSGYNSTEVEIDCGDLSADPVTLYLPVSGEWDGNMSVGGTADTFKQYSGCNVIGTSMPGSLQFYFGATTTSNLKHVYESAEVTSYGSLGYILARNFGVYNAASGTHPTSTNVTALFTGDFDNSIWEDIDVLSGQDTQPALVDSLCCSAAFIHLTVAGEYLAGQVPLTITQTSSSNIKMQGVIFDGLSAGHPGNGQPNISISDTESGHYQTVTIRDLYAETSQNTSDSGDCLINISGSQAVTIDGAQFHPRTSSGADTSNGICVSSSYNTELETRNIHFVPGTQAWTYPATAVTNSYTGKIAKTDALGNLSSYVSGPAIVDYATLTPPGWLSYFGDGTDGVFTDSASRNRSGYIFATTYTCSGATTITVNGPNLIIRATTSITIGASCAFNATGGTTTASGSDMGGSGGGGGGGTAGGAAGQPTEGSWAGNAARVIAAAGTAGTSSGGTGGGGNAPGAGYIRSFIDQGPLVNETQISCGAVGGAGGTGAAAGGTAGGCIILIAPTITVASGATFTSNGNNGAASAGNNNGGGGGGGGGVIIIRSPNLVDNGAVFSVIGGTGGGCGAFTGCGAGGNGGAGWTKEITQ